MGSWMVRVAGRGGRRRAVLRQGCGRACGCLADVCGGRAALPLLPLLGLVFLFGVKGVGDVLAGL